MIGGSQPDRPDGGRQIGIDLQRSAEQEAFARQGYVVLPSLLELPLAAFFWSYVHTKFASLLLGSGGPLVPDSLGDYREVYAWLVAISIGWCLLGSLLSVKTVFRIDPVSVFRS